MQNGTVSVRIAVYNRLFVGKISIRRRFSLVKGVSRQVIVVHSPDPKLFDQAIFILKDDAVGQGITEEALLKEAQQVIRNPARKHRLYLSGPVWAVGGALVTGLVWLVSAIL